MSWVNESHTAQSALSMNMVVNTVLGLLQKLHETHWNVGVQSESTPWQWATSLAVSSLSNVASFALLLYFVTSILGTTDKNTKRQNRLCCASIISLCSQHQKDLRFFLFQFYWQSLGKSKSSVSHIQSKWIQFLHCQLVVTAQGFLLVLEIIPDTHHRPMLRHDALLSWAEKKSFMLSLLVLKWGRSFLFFP